MKLSIIVGVIVLFAAANVSPGGEKPVSTERIELVRNSALEDDLAGWSLVASDGGDGRIARDATGYPGETNSHSLRLTVDKADGRCGVANDGAGGMSVRAGIWYDLTFSARTEKRENGRGYGLTISLENQDGTKVCARTTLPEVGGEWNQYQVALHARLSDPKARLIVTVSEPGTIWFDNVSLKPRAGDNDNRQQP